MTILQVPRVAFLGVCDRFSKVRNVDPNLSGLNVIGLRREVVSSIYPLPLGSLGLVFAVYDAASTSELRIVGTAKSIGASFWINVGFRPYPAGQVPIDPMAPQELLISSELSWATFVMPFPETMKLIAAPDRFELCLEQDAEKIPVGTLDFLYAPALPLTEDRIAAIRSDPRASKYARMELGCQNCNAKINIYTGLEKSTEFQDQGVIWYREIADRFRCECGNTDIDLRFLRESFHSVLGERTSSREETISLTQLYEVGALETTADRFYRLLDRDPEEIEVQSFLEETPLLFHRFSPAKILKKAPLLNRYQTDFAILSRSGELVLVEIEKPGKKLLRKDGGRSADFNHALDQVQDWLYIIQEHRLACLEMMGLKNDRVTAIRGVVIVGRDIRHDREQLRKLKSSDLGPITLFTYDDLAQGLEVLIAEMKEL